MITNLIGGRWTEPAARKTLPVYNPASGEVIEQVSLSSGREVEQAVAAAADSFELWAATPVMERARLMFRYKSLLEEDLEELAAIITRHHGKPWMRLGGRSAVGSTWSTSLAARRL